MDRIGLVFLFLLGISFLCYHPVMFHYALLPQKIKLKLKEGECTSCEQSA